MLVMTPHVANVTFIVDSAASATGDPSSATRHFKWTHRFKEHGTSLVGENYVNHETESLEGIFLPAADVTKREIVYQSNAVRANLQSSASAKTSVVLHDHIRSFGCEFVHQESFAKATDQYPESAQTYIAGFWGSGAFSAFYYVLDLHRAPSGATPTSGKGFLIESYLFSWPNSQTLATLAEQALNVPTVFTYAAGVKYRQWLGFPYVYLQSDGIVADWGKYGSSKVRTWASLDAFAEYLKMSVLTSPVSGWSTGASTVYRITYRPSPLLSVPSDSLNTVLSTFPETYSWIDGDPTWSDIVWSDPLHRTHGQVNKLIQDCADGAKYTDMNSVAYVADLVTLKSTLSSVASSAVNLAKARTVKKGAKAAANLYLGNRYGTILTYEDTRSLFKLVKSLRSLSPRWGLSRLRSAYTDTGFIQAKGDSQVWRGSLRYTAHCKVVYSEPASPIAAAIKSAMEWDIWPTLQNCWDFIPYSFVLDWMLPIDNLLTNIDNSVYVQYLQVAGVVLSTKVEGVFPGSRQIDASTYFVGFRTTSSYNRWVEREIRKINPFVLTGSPSSFHTGVEATALVVQKVR